MTYDIEMIKQSITVQELLVRRGFEVAGNRRKICSPIRAEKTPSFSISQEGRHWHDFGSGDGGDVIDLEMQLTGCAKGEAIRTLAGIVGISGEESDYDRLPMIPPPPAHHAARRLGPMTKPEVARELRHALKKALETSPLLSACQTLAWLPPEARQTVLRKGFLGADLRGRLVYIMRRGLKVRTTPESSRGDRWTEGKSQDNALFSWQAKDLGADGPTTVILTEGESDAMAAIATWDDRARVLGCLSCSIAPPMEILYAVARQCDRAIIAFDGDKAGHDGALNMMALLQRLFPAMELVNFRPPNRMDLKKLYLEGDLSKLDKLIAGV